MTLNTVTGMPEYTSEIDRVLENNDIDRVIRSSAGIDRVLENCSYENQMLQQALDERAIHVLLYGLSKEDWKRIETKQKQQKYDADNPPKQDFPVTPEESLPVKFY